MGFQAEFVGPLPPPQVLQGYEQACPGAASRVIEMAEKEGLHRRAQEDKIVDAQVESMRRQFMEARIGQILAFAVAVFFLGCGTYTVVSGYPIAGSFFSAIGLGGIVTTFIIGRDRPKNEVKEDPNELNKKPRPRKELQSKPKR